jgi:hypothetical protein
VVIFMTSRGSASFSDLPPPVSLPKKVFCELPLEWGSHILIDLLLVLIRNTSPALDLLPPLLYVCTELRTLRVLMLK